MAAIKSVGIDPGTKSWDIVCLKGEETIWEESVPTLSLRTEADNLIDGLVELEPDVVSAPSGFGLPLTELKHLDERKGFEVVLKRREERTVMGLLNFLFKLKETGLKSFILPSVKHLQTVPIHRKINRIDMGTPDKICSTAYSMHFLDKEYDVRFNKASFIHCELGYAFNAFISVSEGRIVDGIGGSVSSGGNLCQGMLDLELAYLRGGVDKSDLVKGGFEFIDMPTDVKTEYLVEAILGDIYRLLSSAAPDFIVFSFRDEKPINSVVYEVMDVFEGRVEVVSIPSKEVIKPAASGSAFIANGLAGGKFKNLVDVLDLRNSSGSLFDYIYPPLDVSNFF